MTVRDGQLMAPPVLAWIFLAPGVIGVVTDIVRLQITGVFLLGVLFLALWAWLLGAFTRAFWSAPTHPNTHASIVKAAQRQEQQ